MDLTFTDRLKHAWNAFNNKDPTYGYRGPVVSYSYRQDRARFSRGNEKTIVTAVYNRIAMDVAAIDIEHVMLDNDGRFLNVIDSGLNNCLGIEANIDQTGRSLIQDIVISMFDEGCVAVVPIETRTKLKKPGLYEIDSLRTAKILEWMPSHIKVRLYNELIGQQQEVILPKKSVAIIENPFYSVMNEPNSTLQRLIRKLAILDAVDEQSGSGKMDLIIQLPYTIKTESRRKQAEERRNEIETQLAGSKYGIAYTDGTEKITQLNRPVENNLMAQIEYLTNLLFSQLGMTQSIMDGTADDRTMINYRTRIVKPILRAICDEFKRKFLTKTARSRNQSIMFFQDMFELATLDSIAEASDKFTRNQIITSNEVRQFIGLKPSDDPNADVLKNSNMPMDKQVVQGKTTEVKEEKNQNEDEM